MKNLKILFLIITLMLLTTTTVYAKHRQQATVEDTESVRYLKQVNEQGQVIRSQDEPIHKADISADVKRANRLKDNFRKEVKNSIINVVITK